MVFLCTSKIFHVEKFTEKLKYFSKIQVYSKLYKLSNHLSKPFYSLFARRVKKVKYFQSIIIITDHEKKIL